MSSEFESVVHDEDGIIAWRRGTGGNVELTYVLTKARRDGAGKRLFQRMLEALKENPPYATVYGFTRSDNDVAMAYYRSLGFALTPVNGVYDDGRAVVFSQRYDKLLELAWR